MSETKIKQPTFLILGAAKAGTTSLYHYLNQHPDIFMAYPKEPFFFEAEYEQGLDYYWNKYFNGYGGQLQIGEARHRNLYLPFVPKRVAASLPNAKFIVICRHPIERAFSHYWYLYTRKQELLSFENALEKNFKRLKTGPFFTEDSEIKIYEKAMDKFGNTIEYPSYIDSGYYAEQIQRYIDLFGLERMKIIFFEDLVSKTNETMADIFKFLEVKPIELIDTSAQNQPVPQLVSAFYRTVGAVPGIQLIPGHWRESVKRKIGGWLKTQKPKMDSGLWDRLVPHFKPHNDRLAEMTGRGLDHWSYSYKQMHH